jgi:acetyl esterase
MTYAFDPELAPFVSSLRPSGLEDPEQARRARRERVATMSGEIDTSGLEVRDHLIPSQSGAAPPVRVRVYRPENAGPNLPAVLYLHGGGFVLGDDYQEDLAAVTVARDVGALVVSVDYRLAPEHPFPAAIDDCYTALVWLSGSSRELGVDQTRIAVFGMSAGGGLAAAIALMARDQEGPVLCFQCLGIPALDDRLTTTSMRSFVDTPQLDLRTSELMWGHYLGGVPEDVSPYAAPARATDLRGLPPAYVSVMEFDPLRDEAIAYAARLLEAGVSVELHVFPGTFHGSHIVATAQITRRAAAEEVTVFRRALGLDGVGPSHD